MLSMLSANDVYQFGDQFELKIRFNIRDILKDLESFNDKWSQYNPRKEI